MKYKFTETRITKNILFWMKKQKQIMIVLGQLFSLFQPLDTIAYPLLVSDTFFLNPILMAEVVEKERMWTRKELAVETL